MKKRLLALLLAGAMVFALAACGDKPSEGGQSPAPGTDSSTPATTPATPDDAGQSPTPSGAGIAAADLKIGLVMIGEENDNGYNYNHMVGMEEALANCGLSKDQLVIKRNVGEDAGCTTAIQECIDAGAQIIFCNSFGHEQFMIPLAEENPDIQFCHATGYQASQTENTNDHNYFTKIFEARYLAGIAAGLKAKEINNPKLGYVGAFPFAEVVSGFTAFYLGAKSVYPEVTMEVQYTNSWSDAALEAQVAKALIDNGCGVISQHSDTTAPATTAQNAGAFQVGYNADMIDAAPEASLVSARVDWGVYYTFALNCMMNGEEIPTDWCQGFKDGAVYLSRLNEDIIAPGTQEAIEAAEKKFMEEDFHVFSGPLNGYEFDSSTGDKVADWSLAEGDFYDESGEASAPSFCWIIDGITNTIK